MLLFPVAFVLKLAIMLLRWIFECYFEGHGFQEIKETGSLLKRGDNMSREFPCMKRWKKGENSTFCSICQVDFTIGHGGCNDTVRDIGLTKHIDNEKAETAAANNSQKITHFFQKEDSSVINAETMFSGFLAEHNIPWAVSDHAGLACRSSLQKDVFPDSSIAKKCSCMC